MIVSRLYVPTQLSFFLLKEAELSQAQNFDQNTDYPVDQCNAHSLHSTNELQMPR